MDKKTFIAKVYAELERQQISNRDNFVTKAFVNPDNDADAELTLNGAQIVVVISSTAKINFKFYKIDEKFLEEKNRTALIEKLKEQYPGLIFFVCGDGNNGQSKTIDIENNMIIVENEGFDTTVELCGGIDKFFETML